MTQLEVRRATTELAARYDEFGALYATAPVGLCMLDQSMRYVRINKRLAEINGLPAEAHIGRTVTEMVPGIAESFEPICTQVLATKEPVVDNEVVGETPAQPGVERCWRETWAPILDAEGEVAGIHVVAEEITEQRRAARELAASEARFRSLFEAAGVGMVLMDANCAMQAVNSTFCTLVGRTEQELIGTSCLGFTHPDDVADNLSAVEELASSAQTSVAFEKRYLLPNRAVIWVRLNITDLGGGQFLAIVEDVTARIEAGRRAAHERERLMAAFVKAPGFICTLRGPEHVFDFVNDAHQQLFGERKLVGKTVREGFPDLEGQGFYELLDRVFATGERHVATRVPARLRSGPDAPLDERYLNFIYEPLRDESGRVSGIVCEGYDVTAEVLAGEALIVSEAQLATIFGQAPAGLGVIGLDGHFQRVNEALCTLLDRPREELLALRVEDVTHPDDFARNWALVENLLSTGEPFTFEKRYVRPDGSLVWASSSVSLLGDQDGRPRALMAVTIDISEQKAAAERLRESEERLRAAVLASPFPVMLHADDGEVLEVSRKWLAITGYGREELRTHFDWGRRAYPDRYEQFEVAVAHEFVASGDVSAGEWPVRTKDGSTRIWDFHVAPLQPLPDGRRLKLSAAVDVTDAVRAKNHQRLLIDELNHRVKNSLAIVQGIAQQTFKGVGATRGRRSRAG
jgi:PAS domain S-box-containing protein